MLFWNLKKNIKYVFSNIGDCASPRAAVHSVPFMAYVTMTEDYSDLKWSLMKKEEYWRLVKLHENEMQRKYYTTTSGGSRKKYWGGGWPLIIWEATTAKRNYYRTN